MVTYATPSNLNAVQVFNALVPSGGPKAVVVNLLFSGGTTDFLVDFTLAVAAARMSVVQTFFVDNFANPATLQISCASTGQTLEVPAYSQGFFPVLGSQLPKFAIHTVGGVSVTVIALNVPMPSTVWYAAGTQSFSILDKPRTILPGDVVSVAVGGTAVIAINGGRIAGGATIINPTGAPAGESLFIDPYAAPALASPGANGTTIELFPGQAWQAPAGLQGNVWVTAATAGHAYTVLVW